MVEPETILSGARPSLDPIALMTNPASVPLAYAYTRKAPVEPAKGASKEALAAYENDLWGYNAGVTNLLSNADERIDGAGSLWLRDVFVHRVTMMPDGATTPQEAFRCVLIAADGVTYEGVSEGVLQGLAVLFQLCGLPDTWDKPVPIWIDSVKTRRGFHTFTIAVVPPDFVKDGEILPKPKRKGKAS